MPWSNPFTRLFKFFFDWSEPVIEFVQLYWQKIIYRREILEASRIETSSVRLGELALASSPWIHREVAKNANAPASIVKELAGSFPGEVLENPALDLFSLEFPSFFEEVPSEFWSYPKLPRRFIQFALTHTNYKIRWILAKNRGLLFEDRVLLLEDPMPNVRSCAWEKLSKQQRKRLIHSKDKKLRSVVAALPVHPRRVYTEFLSDPEWEVRCRALQNPYLADNPDLLQKFSEDPNTQVRVAVAENEYLPETTRKKLEQDESEEVRSAVKAWREKREALHAAMFDVP
jgi:hypothetical protein